MTIGVGGAKAAEELAAMKPMARPTPRIGDAERLVRIERAQALMRDAGIAAIWLDVSTSLTYFTGLRMGRSERLHGAILPAQGALIYVSPAFEVEKLKTLISIPGPIAAWDEHEDPAACVVDALRSIGIASGVIGIDEMTPFFSSEALRKAGSAYTFVTAGTITSGCRIIKTAQEIALMQAAMDMTMRVHEATARILHEGISTAEVLAFIANAHQRLGAPNPMLFSIVLFGEATAYPHGVPYQQTLQEGDMVLIDMGIMLDDYLSDITRSYVFGTPNARQRQVWNIERAAQEAAFNAATLGAPCEALDAAARTVIEAAGFGPGYAVPGLPHRTGHGIGLDIHEGPYIVKGNQTPLAPGMTFSNEPMLCLYGEFGVRLEDHIYMDRNGPRWFTKPAHSVDDPFGLEA